jgi:hypothetical protein
VLRGKSPICRWIATLLALPPEGSGQPLRVTFEPVAGREIWTRDFGTAAFESVQFEHHGALCERLGPTTFVFELVAAPTGLKLALRGMRLLGIPLPKRLHPFVDTLEYEQDGRYRFEVESRLPLVGLLVRYAGWLTRAEPPSA